MLSVFSLCICTERKF